MAVPKTARVVASEPIGGATRIVHLELEDGSPFGFRGGQYAIVNTGVMLAEGKPAKRAYSFFSDDREQRRVSLAVKRLRGGPGSNAMHDAAIGATFTFSGPWGKSYADDAMDGASLLLATDTGITAAMGLARSVGFTRLAPAAELVWCVDPKVEFLPHDFVRDYVEASGVRLSILETLPVDHPERLDHVRAIVDRHVDERGAPSNAFLSGDGLLVYGVREQLTRMGLKDDRVKLEAFFNNPARKAA
jgi:ferredoxin-NADP reductase